MGSYDRFNGQKTFFVGFAEQLMFGFGLEYWYDKIFALRTGYYNESSEKGNRKFLTLCAGSHYSMVGVDFSYLYIFEEDHLLANTIRLSLLINLSLIQ